MRISAFPKQQNETTGTKQAKQAKQAKRLKRNDRNDQNETTVMTKTKPLQRWRRVEDEMSRAEYVDFTSDILSHNKAVSRNFIFSSSRAVEIIIWHFYVASRTERQPYRIPSVYRKETKKQITIFSDSLYVRDCFIDFFQESFLDALRQANGNREITEIPREVDQE